MPKLHFPQPEFATHSCDLPEGKTTVGRSSRNNLVLSDPSVSADHGELQVSWNEVIVRDHGSSNGTWVAGVRVEGQRPANHGDLIRFGRVEARLELDGFPADDATSVTANFGVSRVARPQPDPESARVVVGSVTADVDTRTAVTSHHTPVSPKTPVAQALPQAALAKPVPSREHAGRRWLIVALGLGVLLAAVWVLQRLR